MATILALLVVWSIVAMALCCCYRLWYSAPTESIRVTAPIRLVVRRQRRAA